MIEDYSTSFLQLEKQILALPGVESISSSILEGNQRTEYVINFKARSVALVIVEIDPEVNQLRVRFANNVLVDEWVDSEEVVAKLVKLVKTSLKDHFNTHSKDHNEVPEVPVYPRVRNRAGPEVLEQIFMISQDPKLFSIFLKQLNYAKKAKGKIIPWIQHAKGLGWSPGTELPSDSKKALPLVLKKISSKGTLQLIEAVEATQRNRQH